MRTTTWPYLASTVHSGCTTFLRMKKQVAPREGSIVDVPVDLLAGVLQHIQQKERLQCCALVCKRWRLAANLATRRVVDATDNAEGVRSLSAWLHSNRYVNRLQSIQMKEGEYWNTAKPSLQLPFAKLARLSALKVSHCCLEVAASDATAPLVVFAGCTEGTTQFRSLAALTTLSRLELNNTLLDLSELGSCTGLRHLHLDAICHLAAANSMDAAGATVTAREEAQPLRSTWTDHLAAALPELTQLTYLGVRPGASAVINYLSSLHNLQELKLGSVSTEDLAHIPTSLRVLQLELQWAWTGQPMSALTPHSFPRLQQMTQLQHLHLSQVLKFDPVLLFYLTQLTWLCLGGSSHQSAAAVEQLMAGLQQLKHLKHLDISNCLWEQYETELPASEVSAALTASSHLTHLDISNCCFLPEVSDHLFAAADALRSLKRLVSGQTLFTMPGSFESLVASCPALEHLELQCEDLIVYETRRADDLVDIDVQGLAALSRLQSLSKLVFRQIDLTDDAMQSISACSQLRDLSLNTQAEYHTPLTAAGMLYLTQLTALTRCKLSVEFMEREFVNQVLISKCSPP